MKESWRAEKLGTILVVSGPSGVGKSTVLKALRERRVNLKFSISCTTRPPRGTEKNGVEYYFLSREEFEKKIAENAFVEYACVFNNYYGTLKSEILDRARAGREVCLDIDIQGARKIRKATETDPLLRRCCEFVFIVPPSMKELERRLRSRATDSAEQIALRLGKAEEELSAWPEYDYLVVNDELDKAVEQFEVILKQAQQTTRRIGDGQ